MDTPNGPKHTFIIPIKEIGDNGVPMFSGETYSLIMPMHEANKLEGIYEIVCFGWKDDMSLIRLVGFGQNRHCDASERELIAAGDEIATGSAGATQVPPTPSRGRGIARRTEYNSYIARKRIKSPDPIRGRTVIAYWLAETGYSAVRREAIRLSAFAASGADLERVYSQGRANFDYFMGAHLPCLTVRCEAPLTETRTWHTQLWAIGSCQIAFVRKSTGNSSSGSDLSRKVRSLEAGLCPRAQLL
jgi:hypothetical protein